MTTPPQIMNGETEALVAHSTPADQVATAVGVVVSVGLTAAEVSERHA